MATPPLSCSTDAHSNALTIDSDDEVDQSSMWVQQEDRASSDLPPDFLEPLSPGVEAISLLPPFPTHPTKSEQQKNTHEIRQFWKSGDFTTNSYEGASFATEGMDHARVHPKFLHSNATSHKWVLGAIAELLDNAVDEIRNGATFVKVDVQKNPRDGEPMLVIEDDGGGMDPECMRRCMSLGYSAKSKLSNTIGQYGNGFKTSTMRLGADVIVFSRNGGSKPSESIGMMSYTFLTSTGQNDIVVPTVDFQIEAFGIRKLIRSNVEDWMESMQAIESWSPYTSQAELVSQFKSMPRSQGTKVIIYNLWEDDEGCLELDFTTDRNDIQIRSTSRDEKVLKLAARYPSCKHYLTYRHSLRTYISILYLRLPAKFRIFLRGNEVEHHNLRNEMMLVEQVTYRPKDAGHSKAVVTLGFVKDAKEHIDVSGFNVYHKNRLIRPFWRIWNSSDTRGRGIIATLEANFVEPAHDKQGFERTIVLTRLEARLTEMQKSYWNKNCHKIGYNNAFLKLNGRLVPRGKKAPASGGVKDPPTNGVMSATTHADAQLSVIEKTVAGVHDSGVASDITNVQGVSPVVMIQTMQGASAVPSKLEMKEPNLVLGRNDSMVDGVGKSHGFRLHGQDSVQHELTDIHSLQCVQDEPLISVQRDWRMSFPPACFDAPGSHLRNPSSSTAELNSQELSSPCSTGLAPVVIDLDSPDVDQKFDAAVFEMPFPQSCEGQKEITDGKSGILLGTGNACEISLRSNGAAGSPKKNDAETLTDACINFSPLEEVEASPERLGSKSFHVEDVAGVNQIEARPNEPGMEICGQSNDLIASGIEECLATPFTSVKDGEQVELETLGQAALENGIELDDFFDSLAPQSEVPPQTPQSMKDTEAFVQSPAMVMDLILPGTAQNATPENDRVPLLSSFAVLGGNEPTTSNVTSEDAIKQHENKNSQVFCEDVMEDCNKSQLLPGTKAIVLPDMDATMMDVEGQKGDDCLRSEQDNGNDHVAAVTEQHIQNNLTIVSPTLGGIQASCQAMHEDLVRVPTMAIFEVAAGGIAINCCSELLEEDRLSLANQQREYLQQSIEAVVVEVDDLKEQLQQDRELERLELRNLSMELERALSRLEELRG